MKIYIPLWLYCNSSAAHRCRPLYLYLHSTLVILQFGKRTAEDQRERIYIPLWLYYNALWGSTRPAHPTSTFHSGYITIRSDYTSYDTKAYLHSTLVILQLYRFRQIQRLSIRSTFHSGYITIEAEGRGPADIEIYIPLWLYYNTGASNSHWVEY